MRATLAILLMALALGCWPDGVNQHPNAMRDNPFRKCDYCGSTANSNLTEPRLARRAWTIFPTTRKLACPKCDSAGRADDNRLRLLIATHFGLLRNRLCAEPPATYGDAPMRKTHRILVAGHPQPLDVCKLDDRFFGLDGNWDVPVNDRTVRVLARYDREERPAEPEAAESQARFGLQRRWERIKADYPDSVVLMRVGDRYLAFGADAQALWNRCGFRLDPVTGPSGPFSQQASFHRDELDTQLPAIVRKGFRVALCDTTVAHGADQEAAEPVAPYKKPPSRTERYLANDKRMVLERLLDLEVVLRRHKALPDYTGCERKTDRDSEDWRANRAFDQAHDAIAMELRLRNAELVHDSIRCRIGNADCVFTVASLPGMIRDYRRNARNTA